MNEEIKIEKGIPIPERNRRKITGGHVKLVSEMEAGDSCFIHGKETRHLGGYYYAFKQLGLKVVMRKQDNGVRIWRIA